MKPIIYISILISTALSLFSQTADEMIIAGHDKLKSGDYKAAYALFSEVIEKEPNRAGAYFARGIASNYMKYYVKAIIDFDKAIKLKLYDNELYEARAFSNINLKNYENAIKDCQNALAINPKSETAYLYASFAKTELGKFDEALALLDIAVGYCAESGAIYFNRANLKIKLNKSGICQDLKRAKQLGIKEAENLLKKYCD